MQTTRWIPHPLGLVAGAGGGYFVLAWLGYAFMIQPAGVALWPASGFLLGLLLLLDRRDWAAVLLGAYLGNLAADLLHGSTPALALAAGVANGLEALVAAGLLRRFLPRPITVGTLREVAWLVLGGALLSNSITALGGAAVLHRFAGDRFWTRWLIWWVGDGMGMLIVTPVILSIASLVRDRVRLTRRRLLEAVVVLGLVALVALLVIRREPGSSRPLGGWPFLAFPPLLWAAVWLGPWGAALATLVLGCVTAWNAAHTAAPTTDGGSMIGDTLQVVSFLALASVSSLVPASILAEQRRIQRRLAEGDERFRQMAESIKEAFFVVDLATRVPLYVSPTWGQIWGRPMSDGGDPAVWFEAVHPDDREKLAEDQRRVAMGESSITNFRVLRPDGTVRWVRGRAFPVRDGAGAVYRMVGVAEDVTELRQTELQLAHAQKLESVGRLAGGVAHDFNNLLTVILAETDLLLAEPGLDGETVSSLDHVRQAADRAAVLTRQLLAFSRRQVVEPVVFDLNRLVRELTSLLRRLIGEDLELVVRAGPDPVLVRADRGQIEQVIANLAVNARDAMPEGGTLALETGTTELEERYDGMADTVEPGLYAVLAVSDTGTGMSEAVRVRVFEPFFTTKERGKGTGLGLSTSYGIARQAGGQLTVHSEPGAGSTFRLYLPRVEGTVSRKETGTMGIPTGTETILVVEDEAAVRRVAARMLQGCGYQVLVAPDAEAAKQLIESYRHPIHLLLTDVVLPGQGGRELAEEVLAIHPDLKVLFTSGYTDDTVLRLQLLKRGAQLLQKPYTRETLARRVREALD